MEIKILELPKIDVIGVAVRTSNRKELTKEAAIKKLWEFCKTEDALNKILNKLDTDILAVYTEFESDMNGEFTYLLGARVTADALPPEGFVKKTIPAGKFAVFPSDRGLFSNMVIRTWQRIWNLKKHQPGGDRTYLADYEIHKQPLADLKNYQLDVYVGII